MNFTSKDLKTYREISKLVSRANKVAPYYSVEWKIEDLIKNLNEEYFGNTEIKKLIIMAYEKAVYELYNNIEVLETNDELSKPFENVVKLKAFYQLQWSIEKFVNECTKDGLDLDDTRTLILIAFNKIMYEIEE